MTMMLVLQEISQACVKVAFILAIPSYQVVNVIWQKKRGTELRICHRIAAGQIIMILSMIWCIFVDGELVASDSISAQNANDKMPLPKTPIQKIPPNPKIHGIQTRYLLIHVVSNLPEVLKSFTCIEASVITTKRSQNMKD